MKQLAHNDIENHQKRFPITIVCDAIRTPENIGMCFRIAESFGVEKIYFHESSPTIENRIVKKTARNTVAQIEYDIYSDFSSIINKLKQEGNTIIGLEITDKSTPIKAFEFQAYSKMVLILGGERRGIEEINVVDHAVYIPMYGRNSSMNVIHSLAISLFEITNQFLRIGE